MRNIWKSGKEREKSNENKLKEPGSASRAGQTLKQKYIILQNA